MTNKVWARLDAPVSSQHTIATVVELVTLDAALRPGIDVFAPSLTFVDVTGIAPIGADYTTRDGAAFTAPPLTAPTIADLIAYANAKQVALRDGGITVNVGSASTPDLVNVASDTNGRTLVTGCVQLIGVASQASQPAPTFQWINNDGTQLTLTSTQMMAIGLKLGSFVQATYAALGTVLAAIADGSVTTVSAIDAAAWPTTSL